MSLKAFHIVFVAASILLAFFVGGWCVNEYRRDGQTNDLVYAGLSFLAGVGLIFYGKYVVKKLRNQSYL